MATRIEAPACRRLALLLLISLVGCGGPSEREIKNARAFEALLTAVSIRNGTELEADARLIETRHDAGELSDASFEPIAEIIAKARARDWAAAERRAYEFRNRFGDQGAYFR